MREKLSSLNYENSVVSWSWAQWPSVTGCTAAFSLWHGSVTAEPCLQLDRVLRAHRSDCTEALQSQCFSTPCTSEIFSDPGFVSWSWLSTWLDLGSAKRPASWWVCRDISWKDWQKGNGLPTVDRPFLPGAAQMFEHKAHLPSLSADKCISPAAPPSLTVRTPESRVFGLKTHSSPGIL